MFIIYITAALISVAYIILLYRLIAGWGRINVFERGSQNPSPVFISVIIAARNEEGNILDTLISVSNQTLDANSFEVLVVDDFSTDKTSGIIKEFCGQHVNFHQFSLNGHRGKKNAIDYAIKQAKGDLLVTTDADCEHQTGWLKTIREYYLSSNAKMVIAPVLIKSNNWFGHMQALDFLSLMVSGAAATGITRPIMNNGANLAFSKEAYLDLKDPTNRKISSGDDIFLLLKLKKEHADKIHFLKSKKAIVYTKPKKSFIGFINQRKRWASKSKHYNDFDIIFTAFTVLLINVSLLFLSISICFSTSLLFVFILVFMLKSIPDLIFLYKPSRFFQQNNLLRYFFFVQVANLFLVPFLAFSGLFTKTKWKGKIIN